MRPPRPAALVLAATVLLIAPLLSAFADDRARPRSAESAEVAPTFAAAVAAGATAHLRAGYTPASTLLSTDPVLAPHRITRQLVRLIANVPSGESIEVMTYFLGSRDLTDELVAAVRRGVEVRAVFEGHTRPDHRESMALRRALDRNRDDRSWVRFAEGSTRARGGAMHQKTWRFSRVGDAEHVTVTGSYNAGDEADRRAYSLMWQWVDRDVYESFASVWAAQVRQVDQRRPLRTRTDPDWEAYFSPTTVRSPSGDPVMRRLARIPANPRTAIRIAMYSMWDARADWIAVRLAAMARRGARIQLIAGPTVSPEVRAALRDGGVAVHPGCFADGTYTHSKDMSASYVTGGRRQHWTWVGSDNWTSEGMSSDEAVLGIRSEAMHAQFQRYVDRLRARADGVFDGACRPRGG